MKRLATLVAIAAFGLVGCDNYNDRRGIGDAPIGERHEAKTDVIFMPDGYPNIATRCNPVQSGTRIYVVTHGSTDVQPLIIPDESCAR